MIKLKSLLEDWPQKKKEDGPSKDSKPKKLKIDIPDDPFHDSDKEKEANEDVVNETLPAYPREWKNLEKACYDLEKAVKILGKAVEKQDRKKGKMIPNIYKTLEASIKKYKSLIQTEILSKLQ